MDALLAAKHPAQRLPSKIMTNTGKAARLPARAGAKGNLALKEASERDNWEEF